MPQTLVITIMLLLNWQVVPITPDWNVILHTVEDTVTNCIGVLAPRIFGIKTAKVVPTETEFDDNNQIQLNTQMKEKARYGISTLHVQFLHLVEFLI